MLRDDTIEMFDLTKNDINAIEKPTTHYMDYIELNKKSLKDKKSKLTLTSGEEGIFKKLQQVRTQQESTLKMNRDKNIEFTERWDRFRNRKQQFIKYYLLIRKRQMTLK
jgi:hypothetical protein